MCVARFAIKKSLAAVCLRMTLYCFCPQLVAEVEPPPLSMKIIYPTCSEIPESSDEREFK